jgi:hypothetical protein
LISKKQTKQNWFSFVARDGTLFLFFQLWGGGGLFLWVVHPCPIPRRYQISCLPLM